MMKLSFKDYLLGWRFIGKFPGTFLFDWTPEGWPIYTSSYAIYRNWFTGKKRIVDLD